MHSDSLFYGLKCSWVLGKQDRVGGARSVIKGQVHTFPAPSCFPCPYSGLGSLSSGPWHPVGGGHGEDDLHAGPGELEVPPLSPVLGKPVPTTFPMVGAVFKDTALREQHVVEILWTLFVTEPL